MAENSFDPRTWTGAARERAAGPDDRQPDTARPGEAFPLATLAALRLWLTSALVLAIAAAGAWAMRGPHDAAPRLAAALSAPADQAQDAAR